MTPPPSPFAPGQIVAGKYRVERELGQGGMGVVVAARHVALDERVAIKFLLGQDAKGSATRRFLREARAAAKVKSDHVCRVFDFGNLDTGEPYLVMEYLEGTDLAEKLTKDGPQRVHVVAGWIIEVCEALAAAHAAGIVHRDLKPANVFLAKRKDGSTTAKVLDFGISKLPTTSSWSTQPLAMLGTPLYMSPEQLESARDVDARTDVWSLGAMMYELLTGRPPFEGDTLLQLAVQIRERAPRPIGELNREVPSAIGTVIARCLEKRREDRYANVAELVTDLAPFAMGEAKAIADRIGRHVVRASDPDRALEAEDVNEPTFPNSADHLVPPPAPSSSRGQVDSTEAHAPTVDSSRNIALAAESETPETLVGVQSTRAPTAKPARGRTRTAVVAGAAAAVVAVLAFAARSPAPANETPPSGAPSVGAAAPPVDKLVAPGPASATAEPVASAPAATTVASATSSASALAPPRDVPRAHAPVAPGKAGPTTTALLAPGVASAPKPAPAPSGKTRRELDRDDPL